MTLLLIGIAASWILLFLFGCLLGRAAAMGDRLEVKRAGRSDAPARDAPDSAQRYRERRAVSRPWSDAALARMGEEALRRELLVVKRALRTAEARLAELEREPSQRAAS